MPRPRKLRTPDRRWGSWFLKKYGWSLLSRSSDQQQSLPYSHDDMRVAREDYQKLLQSGVHGALILNYDQLWRCCWSHNSRLMFKAGNRWQSSAEEGRASARKQESGCGKTRATWSHRSHVFMVRRQCRTNRVLHPGGANDRRANARLELQPCGFVLCAFFWIQNAFYVSGHFAPGLRASLLTRVGKAKAEACCVCSFGWVIGSSHCLQVPC